MASNENFINYKDFDIENLSLCEGKVNSGYGYRTFKIKYTYPDGVTRNLRLRSPVLFSYGVKKCKEKSPDYFMTLKSFYDEFNMEEKEIAFRKTLDSISEFLRKELEEEDLGEKSCILKRDHLKNMDFTNESGTFFPKLRQSKTYEDDKITKNEITTVFWVKEEDGTLSERDPSFITGKRCKVVVYIDISDIFVRNPTLKIRTYLSDVIVIKTDVPPPNDHVKTVGISLGSDDEK